VSSATRELERGEWAPYFDSLAPAIEGLPVTIEVMSEQIGDQTDVERLPLSTITFDSREEVLEVAVGGRDRRYPVLLRHLISGPRSIAIEGAEERRPSAILITDAEGVRTLVRLFEPAALEP